MSDNGGAYEADVGGFKGGKTDLHEGGIRVPMVVNWPGKIAAGTSSDMLGHTNDVLPTLCAAAGVAVPASAKVDGVDLLPHMTGRTTRIERGTVFWQMDLYKHLQRHYPKPKPYSTEVARRGRWKLLALEGKPQELFDIEADPFERNNLLDQHPEIVRELTAQLEKWLAESRLSPYGE
jgi:N-acetylgalactosamine-6-sulfatase